VLKLGQSGPVAMWLSVVVGVAALLLAALRNRVLHQRRLGHTDPVPMAPGEWNGNHNDRAFLMRLEICDFEHADSMIEPLEVIMPQNITLSINGKSQTVSVEPDSMLLYALRDELGLRGPKFGCGLAECGACTVVMDGNAIRSCVTPVSAVGSSKITTLEGLGTIDKPHPLQKAFIEEQAVQCGYCINGMIMAAKALLDQTPHPSRDDIKEALDGNLCRCGTHMRIVRAIERAAAQGE
jgi:nicotinate dehydrogenase subunit A